MCVLVFMCEISMYIYYFYRHFKFIFLVFHFDCWLCGHGVRAWWFSVLSFSYISGNNTATKKKKIKRKKRSTIECRIQVFFLLAWWSIKMANQNIDINIITMIIFILNSVWTFCMDFWRALMCVSLGHKWYYLSASYDNAFDLRFSVADWF